MIKYLSQKNKKNIWKIQQCEKVLKSKRFPWIGWKVWRNIWVENHATFDFSASKPDLWLNITPISILFWKALLSLFYLCSSNIYALINYVGFATWVMYIRCTNTPLFFAPCTCTFFLCFTNILHVQISPYSITNGTQVFIEFWRENSNVYSTFLHRKSGIFSSTFSSVTEQTYKSILRENSNSNSTFQFTVCTV